MADAVKHYWSDEIDLTFEAGRCIHAAECVRGLPQVFDTSKRPWVQPGNAQADTVAEVVLRCPTGALHFERKDGGAAEAAEEVNIVRLNARGPLYLRGDIELHLPDGDILRDTRMALCRCGNSRNKPFCDNSHLYIGFDASGEIGDSRLRQVDTIDTAGRLVVTPILDGPLRIQGDVRLLNQQGSVEYGGNRASLCRCGGSQNKPFCDSTHTRNGFQAEGL